MNVALKIILLVLVVSLGAAIGWGLLKTRKVERDPRQAAFAAGTARIPVPGRYAGSSGEYTGSWQGKVLDENGRGENLFKRESGEELKYPFAYYVGQGVRDKNLDVVVLDYNQPGNPWWLRYIRDEIVATGDNKYLGKVHVWVLPGVYFSLGYFELTLR